MIAANKNEAHFSEAVYFDELAEEGQVDLAWSRGTPLLIWKHLEVQGCWPNNSAHTSTSRPGPSKQSKSDNKRAYWGDDFPGKVRVAYGRTIHLLWCFVGLGPSSGFEPITLCALQVGKRIQMVVLPSLSNRSKISQMTRAKSWLR